jgi:membrane peptidoglycan carboxypeptidase
MARKELERSGLSDDQISGGGLKVITTFNSKLQADAVASRPEGAPENTAGLHIGLASVKAWHR